MESPTVFQPLIGAMNIPLTRPSGTPSPSEGERDGVRGRFMESRDLDLAYWFALIAKRH